MRKAPVATRAKCYPRKDLQKDKKILEEESSHAA